jgi:hypothetical protein
MGIVSGLIGEDSLMEAWGEEWKRLGDLPQGVKMCTVGVCATACCCSMGGRGERSLHWCVARITRSAGTC